MKTKKRQLDFDALCHFTDKQKEASRAVKRFKYVVFGGAMGGGKSYFLRWKLLRMLLGFTARGHRHVTVGLFCEDYPALKDRHLSKVRFEFPGWLGEYNSTDHNFVLKEHWGGGVIAFRNLDDPSKYMSSEFSVIAVDELTKNGEDVFMFLRTRLRWPGIPDTKFIGATNPGGVGHEFVKRLWVDRVHADHEQEADQFHYVQARVADNPYIDPAYLKTLQSLPEDRRKAYLEGSWDLYEGQYFTEWDKEKHVVEPFDIPERWFRYRSIDVGGRFGITSCHWYAVDFDGNVWVYREYYATNKDADQHAREILEMSRNEQYRYTVIDRSALNHLGLGETTAEVYMRHGIDIMPTFTKDRLAGWDIVHQYLRCEAERPPKLRVFKTCRNMIRTLPQLVHDETKPEDLDTRGEDHAADELRYFLQTLRGLKAPPPLTTVKRKLLAKLGGRGQARLEEWNEIEAELLKTDWSQGEF